MNRIGKQKRRGLEQIKMGLRCGDDEAERILQRVYRNIGMSVMEMLYMPRLVREKITSMIMCASSIQNIWKRPMRKGKELSALRRISATGNGWARGSLCTATPRRRSAKQADDALMKIINDYRTQAGQHIYLTGTGGYEMIAAARAMKKIIFSAFFPTRTAGKRASPYGS